MENLYKGSKIFSVIALLLTTSCVVVSTVEMPKAFSECPDINGTYNNINRNKIKKVVKVLGEDLGDGTRMDTLYNSLGKPTDVLEGNKLNNLKFSTLPGLVHVYWLDNNKTNLVMILDVNQLRPEYLEDKTMKQEKSILFRKYFLFQNGENADFRNESMPGSYSIFFCSEGKVKYRYGIMMVPIHGYVVGEKGEFIFYLDRDGNLNSELTWSAREYLASTNNNLDRGFWDKKEPSLYQMNHVDPSTQIAAILANIYIGLSKDLISINSTDELTDIRMSLMHADIELWNNESRDKAKGCEHLNAVTQHKSALGGNYAAEIFNDIESIKKNLQCDKKMSHSQKIRI